MVLKLNEINLIKKLRDTNPSEKIPSYTKSATFSEIMADKITSVVGSWRFLIIQSCILVFWVVLNIAAYIEHWDPYPFILLNLLLSFQAAYTAPIILMSQNREAKIDRAKLSYYYDVNLKQELEIELLQQKMDVLLQHLGVNNHQE
jgi:uncharacterized membrane protein